MPRLDETLKQSVEDRELLEVLSTAIRQRLVVLCTKKELEEILEFYFEMKFTRKEALEELINELTVKLESNKDIERAVEKYYSSHEEVSK